MNPLHLYYPQIAAWIQVIIINNIGCWANVSVYLIRDYLLVSSSLLLTIEYIFTIVFSKIDCYVCLKCDFLSTFVFGLSKTDSTFSSP